MHQNLTFIIVITTIVLLVLLIALLLLSSIVRRIFNDRKYRGLDVLRQEYMRRIQQALNAGGIARNEDLFVSDPKTLAWQAVEEVLMDLIDSENGDEVKTLFRSLGYVTFYENRLAHRNALIRASAIDKLGKMQCPFSTPKLVPLLDEKDHEILSVTVRALSKIGEHKGLTAIIERLPVLLGGSLVTRKAMETALLNFGEDAIPHLIGHHTELGDPWILSCVLETLSHLPPDIRATQFAGEYLKSLNPEVRSKALKVLGRPGLPLPAHLTRQIMPLLDDPVWFVRIQAVRTVNALMLDMAAVPLGKLLFDNNWQVRSEAALALTRFGDGSLGIFSDALMTTDSYAKESVCEEIEKTGFCDLLIKNLGNAGGTLCAQSRKILKIMHRLHFSMPLSEYLENGADDSIKLEIRGILSGDYKS